MVDHAKRSKKMVRFQRDLHRRGICDHVEILVRQLALGNPGEPTSRSHEISGRVGCVSERNKNPGSSACPPAP